MDFLDYESKTFQAGSGYANLQGSDYARLGSSLLIGIGGFISSKNELKAVEANAAAQRAQAEAAIQVARYNAQAEAAKAAAAAGRLPGEGKGMSTGVIVGLVLLGLAVVGGGVYFATRK